MEQKKIKVGVIGCGGIAFNKHLLAMQNIDEIDIVAFCDIIESQAQKAAKEFGAPGAKVYTDYKAMLADKELVAVHVCTPNKSHAPITIAALEAGKHVLCEKPMAKTYADAKLMVEAAKKTGKLLTIGYQSRCRPDSLYLKQACERGDLGDIYYARAHAIRRRAVPTWGVFLNEEEQGGGPLIDIGTHALDLTLWMMNNYKVKSVMGTVYHKLSDKGDRGNAWGPWDPKKFTVEDSAFGFITMQNGATVYIEASWALNTLDVVEAQTSLSGTKAGADMRDGLRINYDNFDKLVVTKPELGAGGAAFFEGKTMKPEDIEARTFYDAVLYNKPLRVLPEEALVVTQILEAIYESAKTGKPVTF